MSPFLIFQILTNIKIKHCSTNLTNSQFLRHQQHGNQLRFPHTCTKHPYFAYHPAIPMVQSNQKIKLRAINHESVYNMYRYCIIAPTQSCMRPNLNEVSAILPESVHPWVFPVFCGVRHELGPSSTKNYLHSHTPFSMVYIYHPPAIRLGANFFITHLPLGGR